MGDSLGVSDPQTVFLSRLSHVKNPIGEERIFGVLGFTYPERSFPAHDAAVRFQIMVLELSCFSILQRQHMACNVPRFRVWIESKTNHRGLEWSVP